MSRGHESLWTRYKAEVAAGKLGSLADLGVPGLPRRSRLGLRAPVADDAAAQAALARLLQHWTLFVPQEKRSEGGDAERQVFDLGMAFLGAAEAGQLELIRHLIDIGLPVNFQHPVFKETALHVAAASGARAVVDALLATGECDLLIRDARGKLAWDNAVLFSPEDEIATLLAEKTRELAKREGVDLFREQAAHLRIRFREPWYIELAMDRADESGS